MRLLRLHVENFGVLQNYDLTLKDGMNVLYEKNGWGKSTLAVFVKAMLYGLPASTKRSLDENERKKYTPWQGGAYGGSLEFVCKKGRFRVERFFAERESGDSFALFDLATNKPSEAFSENLGEELFGIDADGFERSTYLSQRANYARSENTSIRTKLGDLLEDVNDMGNYDTAVEALEKRRKFYQLTGNRGAIADEEKKLLDLRAALEACQRAETQAEQKKEELRACTQAIEGATREEKALADKRERAAEARARAALFEERGRMLSELSALEAKKKETEAIFCGMIPSEEELETSKKMMGELRDTNAALHAIPEASPDAEELAALGNLFAKGVPTADALDGYTAENERLVRMRDRQSRLNDEFAALPNDIRFSAGVPTPEEFEDRFTSLSHAKELQAEIVRAETEGVHLQAAVAKKRRTRMTFSILTASLGVVVAAMFFVFTGTVALAMLIAGGVLAAIGGVLTAVFSRKTEEQRLRERMQASLAEKKAAYAREIGTVEKFLASCATSTEGDLARLLTELSVAAVQSRERIKKKRVLHEQIGEVGRAAEQTRRRLESFLKQYDTEITEDGFSNVLTSLRRDAERYTILRREDMRRADQRSRLIGRKEYLQAQIRPFLKRYDAKGSRTAGEIIASVAEAYAEYRKLCEEYKRRESALRDFIREKDLDRPQENVEVIDPATLAKEESALKARMEALHGQKTRLGVELERLGNETDRIPELEDMIASTDERVKTFTQNCKTILQTQKLLAEAKEGLSTRYLTGMQESFIKHLSTLSEGEVPESVLDSSFDVQMRAFGKSRGMESFSRGMRDAVRFCVRLSLTEALYREGEMPFLLLDDPFVNLDEEHLESVRGLLDQLAQRYQVIHMICHEGRR